MATTSLMGSENKIKLRREKWTNRIMRSKSFDTQEVRGDMPKESRRAERLSHLLDENDKRSLPDRRKKMQRPKKIENCVGENPCQSERIAVTRDGGLCLAQWQWTRERRKSREQ